MNDPRTDALKIEFQLNAMRKGEAISPPELVLQFATDRASNQLRVRKHDGRHRCAACSSLGCRTIPIMVSLDKEVKGALLEAARGKAKYTKVYTVLSEKDAVQGARPCAKLALTVTDRTRVVGAFTANAHKCADEEIKAHAALRRKQKQARTEAALSLKKAVAKQAAALEAASAAGVKAMHRARVAEQKKRDKERLSAQRERLKKDEKYARKLAQRERTREVKQAASDATARKFAAVMKTQPRYRRVLTEVSDDEDDDDDDSAIPL
jgi:hypothetical protein